MLNLAQFIIEIESFNANVNVPLIRRAYEFSDKAHAGQKRESGEPYITHCLEVAFILAEQHLDSTTIAAGLVHDVVEDTSITIEDIRKEFGDEIALLVDGVTKLGQVKFKSREEEQVEFFRKMLLSMARDIRVILIKLADRLHNMRTLQFVDKEKRIRVATETQEVYAPLANRFGIARIKAELEDLAFKYLHPEEYEEISHQIEMTRQERDAYIAEVTAPIKKALLDEGIKVSISGRAKHFASIYRKMKLRNLPLEEIYDLLAVRMIVSTKRECYEALGAVHTLWKPVPNRFHDYIANPKPNGYQSLHTTVFGPNSKMLEIQMRTTAMHHVAENGIAAHWLYKEGRQQMDKADRQLTWLREVLDWQKDMTNPAEFLEYLKIDLFQEDIYVFTPDGDLIHLPAGSTALDFAFAVHSDVGLHTVGAKINGKLIPLGSVVNSGDEVAILTAPTQKPSHDWLRLVHTSKARSKIKRWLKQQGFEQSKALGEEILDRELKKVHLNLPAANDMEDIAQGMGFLSTEALLAAIGDGSISVQQIMTKITPEQMPEVKQSVVKRFFDTARGDKGIRIQGMGNMMFRFAGCCQPVPGEQIIGFITRGRGITIHRADCSMVQELSRSPERLIQVEWDADKGQSFIVKLDILLEDRKYMLRDITQVISDTDANVRGAEISGKGGPVVGSFVVEIKNLSHLNRVIEKVKKIKGVISIERAKGVDIDTMAGSDGAIS
ncbi:MAG: bifunctional (p)ppGpp synthetase/guanosine-3',5'-bis(diphosphate) 3'-pyrophosphohydrolase, partial [candidate division Zixibacteria bacterium]|nr:bifunctional (p)ppGpp synthetase/guanosine-3',5'-bis(diphosphate) 3'-pyrophosphohydrolase [candidate division Zixibacteria bacterium]